MDHCKHKIHRQERSPLLRPTDTHILFPAFQILRLSSDKRNPNPPTHSVPSRPKPPRGAPVSPNIRSETFRPSSFPTIFFLRLHPKIHIILQKRIKKKKKRKRGNPKTEAKESGGLYMKYVREKNRKQ